MPPGKLWMFFIPGPIQTLTRWNIWKRWHEISYLFKRQPLKMVKHTQAIRRQFAEELFEFVWRFCGVCA